MRNPLTGKIETDPYWYPGKPAKPTTYLKKAFLKVQPMFEERIKKEIRKLTEK